MNDIATNELPYMTRPGDGNLRRFIEQDGTGLYIQGPRGSGKTRMLEMARAAYTAYPFVTVGLSDWDELRLPTSGDSRTELRAVLIPILQRISEALKVEWGQYKSHVDRPLSPEAMFVHTLVHMCDNRRKRDGDATPLILALDAYERLTALLNEETQSRLIHVWRTLVDERGAYALRNYRLLLLGRPEPFELLAAGSVFNPHPPIFLGGLTDVRDPKATALHGVRSFLKEFCVDAPEDEVLQPWVDWIGDLPDLWTYLLHRIRSGEVAGWSDPDGRVRDIFAAPLASLEAELPSERYEPIQRTLDHVRAGDTERFDRVSAMLLAELNVLSQRHGRWNFTCGLYRDRLRARR
jgi:hypothetical protein